MNGLMPGENGVRLIMAIIVDKIKVAYIPSPKVACTSLKAMFYRIENEHDFVPTGSVAQIGLGSGCIDFRRAA